LGKNAKCIKDTWGTDFLNQEAFSEYSDHFFSPEIWELVEFPGLEKMRGNIHP